MEAIKIVHKLEDGTDSISFFGNFNNVTIRRGVLVETEDKGIGMKINGVVCQPDKMILVKETTPSVGSPCKQVLLERANSHLSICTDASVYILGTNGKTIEALY
jgi:hypothetical protein